MVCSLTVVRGMLSYKGALGKEVVLWFLFFSYCELVAVTWYEGGNATCDRLKKWRVLWKHLFLQRILELEIKQCFVPVWLYGLIADSLILTALSMQGPSFLPGGPFSPRGGYGWVEGPSDWKSVCPCSGLGMSSPSLPTGYRSVFRYMA